MLFGTREAGCFREVNCNVLVLCLCSLRPGELVVVMRWLHYLVKPFQDSHLLESHNWPLLYVEMATSQRHADCTGLVVFGAREAG